MVFLKVACCVGVLVTSSLSRMCYVPLDSRWPLPKGQRPYSSSSEGGMMSQLAITSWPLEQCEMWWDDFLNPHSQRVGPERKGSSVGWGEASSARFPMLDQDTRHFHLETSGCGFFTTQAMEVVLESEAEGQLWTPYALVFFQNIKVVEKILKDQKVGMLKFTLNSNI